jgi:hypothetical protein
MAEGILVAGSDSQGIKWFTRCAAAVLFLLAVGLIMFDTLQGVGLVVASAAMVLLVVGEVLVRSQMAARRWVVDTGSGLRWTGGPSEVQVEDTQVIAVRMAYRRKHAAGILKHVDRDFQVWTQGEDEPLRMKNRIDAGMSDPLAAMIDRICNDLKARAAAGLADGQPLSGNDWSLQAAELTIRQGRALQTVPFAEIDKVGQFDDRLCIWRRGSDEPVARIDPASKNAPILSMLLNEWTTHQQEKSIAEIRPDRTAEPADDPSKLGRLLFERRKRRMAVYLCIGALIAFWIGLVVLSGAQVDLVGVSLMAGAAAMAFASWGSFLFVFRCHEQGLYRKWGKWDLRVPYSEMTEFSYSAMRHFHNGAYAGTRFTMKFVAPRGTIRYSAMINTPDEELENLRDHIAKVIAGRMLCQLKEGRPVAWTPDMTFLPEGLQFRRTKAFGIANQPPQVIPFDQIRGVDMKQGVFYLWSRTAPKPIIFKPISTPNFFPGFFVILTKLPPTDAKPAG